MMNLRKMQRRSWIAAVAVVAVLAAACSSSASTAGGPSGSANASGVTVKQVAAATAITRQYTVSPGPFPVSAPLPRPLAKGTAFGWLQCGDVVCAQLTGLFSAAAKAIGGRLITVQAGASTEDVQNAFSSLLAQKPAAILLPSIQPDTASAQIQQAKAAGIPTVSTGIMDPQAAGISAGTFGQQLAVLAGSLLADWVATKSATSNVVFYTTHELDFLTPEESAFRNELRRACGGCQERTVNIPLADYGGTAPQLVVSDLESHPATTLAIFGAAAAASGLPAALRVAGINVPFIGFSLTPESLQDIENGSMAAGLGLDYPVLAWTMVDEAARLLLKSPLSSLEAQEMVPVQWLTEANLHGSTSAGWTGYPDYTARFTELWNPR
jgi:ABC-type sugar transport system substrate-binding protein